VVVKRMAPQRIAVIGLVSSSICYLLWGLATEGWMMYAIIVLDIFGMMVSTTLQTVVSTAVDEHSQGRTLGSVASLNSLTAVAAPVIGSFLLQLTAHYPHGDWRIGAPFYLCAAAGAGHRAGHQALPPPSFSAQAHRGRGGPT
jgi:DHA1 family tetracycline resistance protein-like MFS transporter